MTSSISRSKSWLFSFALIAVVSTARAQEDPLAAAAALNAQGGQALNAGQYNQALTLFQRALDLYQRIERRGGVVSALTNIGIVYTRIGQDKRAMDYFERALSLVDESTASILPAVLSNLGATATRLGQPDVAIRYLSRSLQLYEAKGDRLGFAGTLDDIGQAYARMRRWDQALQHQTRALEVIRPTGNVKEVARLLNNIGATAKGKGDANLAIRYLEESLRLTRRFASREKVLASVTNLALLYYDVGKLESAAAAFVEAITINEAVSREIREASKVGEYQDWFRSSLYRRYAHVLIDQKKPEEALAAVERGRLQGLARQAAQNRADFSRVLGGSDGKRMKDANAELSAASAELRKIEGLEFLFDDESDTPEKQQFLAIRRRYEMAEQRLMALRDELYRRSPAYRRLSGAASPSVAELKELAAKHADTLYLQWAVGAEATSLLFAVHKDGIKGLVIPVGEDALTKQVRAWRAAIQKKDVRAETELAKAIYASLFSSVEKEGLLGPDKQKRLVLIGDGPLLDLPFAALLNGEGKRLVEVMPVAVSSSIGVLLWPDDRERATIPIVVTADPVAEIGSPLPAARAEGEAVARLFSGARLFVGEAATRKRVLPLVAGAAILHFATHGLLDSEDGLKSGLLMADEAGQEDDPLLTANELINTRLSAQLAVLSACDTGQGQKSGGEGLLGLTWGFRAAGCPSTVASLWPVDDAATGQLMVTFYQNLIQQKRKDDAMRDAMVAVMKSHPQPFYWAAFQLHGDTKPLNL